MSEVKERPILFSAPMVRAILEGRKSQTRRVLKGSTEFKEPYNPAYLEAHRGAPGWKTICPYGVPGDRLWVKETSIIAPKYFNDGKDCNARDEEGVPRIVQYLATNPNRDAANDYHLKVSPSIFMFRWASRITLEITDVRVQRLQEIAPADAKCEGDHERSGMPEFYSRGELCHVDWFHYLWDSINAKRGFGWDTNPWVWALSFKRVDA